MRVVKCTSCGNTRQTALVVTLQCDRPGCRGTMEDEDFAVPAEVFPEFELPSESSQDDLFRLQLALSSGGRTFVVEREGDRVLATADPITEPGGSAHEEISDVLPTGADPSSNFFRDLLRFIERRANALELLGACEAGAMLRRLIADLDGEFGGRKS